MLDDPRVGMVAAKMRNCYQPERIDAAGLKIGTNGLGYNIGVGETDAGQYDGAAVFGPCGGAALYRREMLDEVGFFDPDFFAYYEDFDLAWRGRLAGWGCVAAPRAVVYHVHSATSGEWSPFKVYQTHRNKWYVIIKNWPAASVDQISRGGASCRRGVILSCRGAREGHGSHAGAAGSPGRHQVAFTQAGRYTGKTQTVGPAGGRTSSRPTSIFTGPFSGRWEHDAMIGMKELS